MFPKGYADDLSATVRYALETTRAIAVCPFHSDVTIRVGDDAAESHAFERAKRIVKRIGVQRRSTKRLVGNSAKRQMVNAPAARRIETMQRCSALRLAHETRRASEARDCGLSRARPSLAPAL